MSPRSSLSVLTAAVLAWCAAVGFAQPVPLPQPRPGGGETPQPAGGQPAPFLPWEDKAFTAFPNLAPPPGDKRAGPRGHLHPAMERLWKLAVAEVPADASPLRKIQLAQVREGFSYLTRVRMRIELGMFRSEEYMLYLEMQRSVFRLAGELAATPTGKVMWYEDAVRAAWEVERFTAARIGNIDPPQQLNQARFWRLGAEADLVRAVEAAKGNR
ncbi:hypothetical protein [Urbifossiella limnaea]|uniref:Uncharacterized protein n=1 Tax=Urbifossiella limnaea TaxID=2528023 RepID=A0A517Y1P7_9BACT|nr:hypothetical protein [Urbifossiella limnaea]QDU23687.1 hypothetical protein ETAA1_56920 [Urbifossiella limnaea]